MSLLERIYFFHTQIQRNRYPNASDLAEEFEVSSATAHRDINYLRDRLLAPLYFNQQKNGYAYSEEGFRLPFEETSKVILLLGVLNTMAEETGLAGLPELQQLQNKLESLAALGKDRLKDHIHCEWIEVEPVDDTVFNTVITALLDRVQLRISYQKAKRSAERSVDPLKLINYQGRWYLLAWCHLRQAKRLFHISRISAAEPTSMEITHNLPPTDTYLTGVFGIFKGNPLYNVTLRFTGRAAETVRHQRWHPEQRLRRTSDGVELTLPVADDREILMKILQFGAQAMVLAPLSLKKKIGEEIRLMSRLYRD